MKVTQIDVENNMKISDLLNQFDESGVLGAGRVARACNILADMIQDEEMSVFMSLGGPLIPGGMRNIVTKMIKEGHVDLIIQYLKVKLPKYLKKYHQKRVLFQFRSCFLKLVF